MHATKKLLLVSFVSSFVLLSGCQPKYPSNNVPPIDSNANHTQAPKQKVDHLARGMQALKQHDIPTAKSEFLAATKNAPNQPASWYSMGYFQESQGQIAAAEKSYKHAVNIAPYSGKTHNSYGAFLCRQKRFRAAVKEFVTAAKDTNHKTMGTAYQNAGLCSLMAKNLFSAKKFFTQAIKANPQQTTSLLQLAKIYYHEGKSEPAIFYLAKYAKQKNITVSQAYAFLQHQQYLEKVRQKQQHLSAKKHHHVKKHHVLSKKEIAKQKAEIIHSAAQLLKTDNKKPGDFQQLSHRVDSLLK